MASRDWDLGVEEEAERISWLVILEVLSQHYGIEVSEILGKGKKKYVVNVRHLAMYLVRERTKASFPAIGRMFGSRHHSTIMSAYASICDILNESPDARRKLEELEEEIKTAHRVHKEDNIVRLADVREP